jgi:hypothetical protein
MTTPTRARQAAEHFERGEGCAIPEPIFERRERAPVVGRDEYEGPSRPRHRSAPEPEYQAAFAGWAEQQAQQAQQSRQPNGCIMPLLCLATALTLGMLFGPALHALLVAPPLDTAQPALAPAQHPPPAIDVQATADAYNAAQAARRAALHAPQATEAPPTPSGVPAPVSAPLNAPDAATPTPLPAPGEPGFVTSFKAAGCAIGITYLDTHDPCYRVPPGAVLPQPGDSSFKGSFH